MRIALFTIWHEMNYGAELQAYATVRALKELGHNVYIIDLRLDDIRSFSFKAKIANFIQRFSPNQKKFRNFWKKNFSNVIRYKTIDELQKNPPEADIYIVGSDQTWNPTIMKSLFDISLLNFGKNEVKRVSYASSFGVNEWIFTEELAKKMKKSLVRFSNISCREKTGCDILKNKFQIDAVNVLDPTLLHSDYSEIINISEEKNEIVYYPLSHDIELEAAAIKLSKKLGLKAKNINKKKCLGNNCVWDRTSIESWLSAISTSKFVLTKSFHGLAFSLIFNRQFAIINNTNRNSRIKDLLERLGLEDRFFSSFEDFFNSHIWERNIDYKKINVKLDELRYLSWEYLKLIVK